MIGKLTGTVDTLDDDLVILDVAGVGYVVHCSRFTLQALPPRGDMASLLIETYVREDQIRLFGFLGQAELIWFRLLITVQGVGVKVALALLGTLTPDEIGEAIARGDKTAIARAPGIGAKVAGRVIAELKDKAPAAPVSPAASVERLPQGTRDAISALVNLGYRPARARAAVAGALEQAGDGASTQALIRLGLRELSQ